jgi:DNA-binding NtrC family response regulator
MALFSGESRQAAEAIGALCYQNPFRPERITLERRALGPAYQETPRPWNLVDEGNSPNLQALGERAARLVEEARRSLVAGTARSPADTALYEDLVRYHLFHRLQDLLLALAQACASGGLTRRRVSSYGLFLEEARRLCEVPGEPLPLASELPHLFAYGFQLRRAFYLIYEHILGSSQAAAQLRAEVWESVFTHDMRRYQRALHARLHEVPTLVTGPSGTGKELVARAIGLSRYIPFDAEALRFTGESATSFFAVNISALSSTLLESELFGHKKGAFTDAVADRTGWLEAAGRFGSVFLDEIGELSEPVQVKLLRVLQTRELTAVGDTEPRRFEAKLVAATNRDLATEVASGRLREDLYYRLCADHLHTPSLHAQLSQAPEDLALFVQHAVGRLVDGDERTALTKTVVDWIDQHLGDDYAWPGNVRELEQCVRAVIVHARYVPLARRVGAGPLERLVHQMQAVELSADAVLDAYCTVAFQRTGSYQEAARRLGLDRRTIKARVSEAWLAELRGEPKPDDP